MLCSATAVCSVVNMDSVFPTGWQGLEAPISRSPQERQVNSGRGTKTAWPQLWKPVKCRQHRVIIESGKGHIQNGRTFCAFSCSCPTTSPVRRGIIGGSRGTPGPHVGQGKGEEAGWAASRLVSVFSDLELRREWRPVCVSGRKTLKTVVAPRPRELQGCGLAEAGG